MSDAYVIDPSALIKGYVNKEFTQNILTLLGQVPDAIELHTPEFCLAECANILWKHVRFSGMPRANAEQAVQDLAGLDLIIHPAGPFLLAALTLGLDHELAVYDSIYIALAQKLQLALITVDVKQERAALQAGAIIKPIVDFTPAS